MILLPLFLAAQTLVPVPVAVRQDLDSVCAGWRIAPVTPETEAEIRIGGHAWVYRDGRWQSVRY